jgi:nitroreductase
MVRNYTDQLIDTKSIDRILDAGIHAPSAGFSQGRHFVVVTHPDKRAAVADAAGEGEYVARGFDPWISKAPVHIVICADKQAYIDRYAESDKEGTDDWTVPYWWVDAGASLMAILYAAVNEDLAAGFLGGHAFENLHRVLGIPEDILIAGLVTVGHPAPDRRSRSPKRGRIPRDEIVHREHW